MCDPRGLSVPPGDKGMMSTEEIACHPRLPCHPGLPRLPALPCHPGTFPEETGKGEGPVTHACHPSQALGRQKQKSHFSVLCS